jgi:hypothetical protein
MASAGTQAAKASPITVQMNSTVPAAALASFDSKNLPLIAFFSAGEVINQMITAFQCSTLGRMIGS